MLYLQKWFGKIIPAEYAVSMRTAYENITGWGDEHRIEQDETFFGTPKEASTLKDLWALEQLAAGDCVIFDCDLIPLKQYDFSKAGAYTIYEWGDPRIGMAASVGDAGRQWWTNRILNKQQRGIPDCYGLTNKLLRQEWLVKDGLPTEIPAEYWTHERLISKTKEVK